MSGGCLRRSRIFRRTIALSHAFSLLRLSQITEPEPEPYPRPPRKRCNKPAVFGRHIHTEGSPTNPDLPLIAHTEYCHHSRTCMASDHGPDVVDQDIVNAHFLADELCHILCVFDAVSVCDHNDVIVPAF